MLRGTAPTVLSRVARESLRGATNTKTERGPQRPQGEWAGEYRVRWFEHSATTGTSCSCQRSDASRRNTSMSPFAPMRRSPSPRSTTLDERDVEYAIRVPANKNLELAVEGILFRPRGRPVRKPLVRYNSFYQADSWTTPRRVVAKAEHHAGELFPRVGFIVTNMTLPSRSVVRFYNKRGTPSSGSRKANKPHWTRLSCHRFRANEVRLQLSVLAYNLGNLWRRLVLPTRVDTWSPTSLQQRLVKTGGRLVKHARYYWLLLTEGHPTRRLFGAMLQRIWAPPLPTVDHRHGTQMAERRKSARRERCPRNGGTVVWFAGFRVAVARLPGAHDREEEDSRSSGGRRV
jgi:hypothetical protein